MKTLRFVQIKSVILILVVITWLLAGCQTNLQVETSTESINVTNETVSPPHIQTPTLSVLPIDEADLTLTATHLIQPPATTTEQPISTTSPTPVPTVTTVNVENIQFYPQIALLAGESGSYPAVGILDTRANSLEIIAQPTSDLSYGRPLWSSSKDLLAFTKFESEINIPSIQIYNPDTTNSDYLGLTSVQPIENDPQTGLLLYGWSNDSQWLAYCYVYESLQQLCYVVNVLTQENISIDLLNSIEFVWSSHSDEFAMTDSESIYIGNPNTPDELVTYKGEGFIGLITWHPNQNEVLIGSSENMAGEGLNQLKILNIDTGEWENVGSFPNLAHFSFSPDGQLIAVHSQSRTLEKYHLEILDASDFNHIKDLEIPSELFYDLDWLDKQTLALTSNDNIYVVPYEEMGKSYWLLNNNDFLYEAYSQIAFTDWKNVGKEPN